MAVVALLGALPGVAAAKDKVRVPEREGLVIGPRIATGATVVPTMGFVPRSAISYQIGGAVSQRWVLGMDLGVTALWGRKKVGFHGDGVAHVFVFKGLFLRGALGVESRLPTPTAYLPGLGGAAGLGYEFAFLKRGAVRIGVDYDVRLRTDMVPVRTVLLAVDILAYLRK